MGRIHSESKRLEKFLIRGFVCNALGHTISHSRWTESPDSILTLQKGQFKKQVAIEHAGYYNDTVAGRCSPLTPISDFWKCVLTSLNRRISHRKHLSVVGGVQLKAKQFLVQRNPKENKELARQFATEVVEFLEAHPISESIMRFPSPSAPRIDTFSGFPMLKSMVVSIWTKRVQRIVLPCCDWQCLNIDTGPIGLNLDYIRTTGQNKNVKAAKYDCGSAKEKWLLIVAAGRMQSEHAGPPDDRRWDNAELRELCCSSPYDRIYFWEYPRRWYKSLKPSHPIVCIR